MEQHLKETGGIMLTRFPPEPNGYLHIGHAKAINVNFGYALANGGKTYLRYDDTNPEAEEERFFVSIKDSVEWLGFKPWKITYSSDHFQKLFDLAVELIRKDKAYVCHCTGEEIHEMRGGEEKGPRRACSHRSRPMEESLKEFQKMKEGRYKEGEAILRMKMDLENPNPQFWDLVAYRVLFTHHFRTADQWCIYPTYDYTHCLCDSFENITHSLCTTEFVASRESYYWLCDALEIYKPVQWEYGRLNITNTVLSKRKLTKLVEGGFVHGWDDPRLYTLVAVKRRGFPAEAVNAFVRDCGVSTAQSTIDVRRLEYFVRSYLDDYAPRVMAVARPILVVIKNLPEEHYQEISVPYFPKTKQAFAGAYPASRLLPFTRYLYIDETDFQEENDPNFFRLSLQGSVNLLNVDHPIYCSKVIRSADGSRIVALEADYVTKDHPLARSVKPKSYIQWVALSTPTKEQPNRIRSPVVGEIRLYSDLFLHSNPMDKVEVPGGWLSDVNPNSLEVVKDAFLESGVVLKGSMGVAADRLQLAVEDKVQFVRNGYFCVDPDSKVALTKRTIQVPKVENGQVTSTLVSKEVEQCTGWVFNRTVSLKEDNKKKN